MSVWHLLDTAATVPFPVHWADELRVPAEMMDANLTANSSGIRDSISTFLIRPILVCRVRRRPQILDMTLAVHSHDVLSYP